MPSGICGPLLPLLKMIKTDARTPLAALLVALSLGLGLGACGSAATPESKTQASQAPQTPHESAASESPAARPSASSAQQPRPSCKRVWRAGKRLPESYSGCSGTGRRRDYFYDCEFGVPLVTHGSHMYAVPGHRVNRTRRVLRSDHGFRSAMRSCGG
jgi:hypothetical protein